ncbi:MAG: TIM barrel protein [Saprospiraceae bacterium]|nr:TIM barrel protein [Saprospiraceae bacterium]
MAEKLSRREAIRQTTLGAGALALGVPLSCTSPSSTDASTNDMEQTPKMTAAYQHSVCKWCYGDIPLEEFCEKIQDLGIKSVEIIGPDEWPIVQKYGLTCALGTDSFFSIPRGFNDPATHEEYLTNYIRLIDQAADAGIPNVICFSGNRNGMDDEVGLENCAIGLDKIAKHAEKKGVMVVMELLNSKVNHKDYMCDHTAWGVKLVDKIGSSNFKLLYDIYHMQIMEGDIIATIRDYNEYFGHYHTGGVPGRNEINATQELNYPAIMRAIKETGYDKYVAQEYIPTWDDQIAALAEGIKICTI